MQELIEQAIIYLNNANQSIGVMDVIVTYIIPIIGSIILVGTAIAGVIKYYKEKERDFAEKMLKEVYAPLFQYIVRQEYFRSKHRDDLNDEEYPIFSISKNKTTKNLMTGECTQSQKEKILDMDDFNKIAQSVNFGLVPTDLLVLINQNAMLGEVIDTDGSGEEKQIGKRIKREVISGYQKYREKLGIDNESDLIVFGDNNIEFKG